MEALYSLTITHRRAPQWRLEICQIFSIILILPLIVEFRKLFDFFGMNLIFGNFITIFFIENNVPLITFIKRLL